MLPMKRYNSNWMPNLFDDFFDNDWMSRTKATAPAINVLMGQKQYKVEVAAPGMGKENFNIHVDADGNLVISMEKKSEKKDENADASKEEVRYLRREFNYGKFEQTLILPEDVDRKAISAKVENGVLIVTLPKLTPEQKQETLQHIEVL